MTKRKIAPPDPPLLGPERFAARVEQGAALLDVERPGWARQIDPWHLSMRQSTSCVLGQLYGSYSLGTHELTTGPFSSDVYTFGFNVTSDDYEAYDYKAYDPATATSGAFVPGAVIATMWNDLNTAWLAQITARVDVEV